MPHHSRTEFSVNANYTSNRRMSLGIHQEFTWVYYPERKTELTNSCECLPTHSVASLSSPIITIKHTDHINKLWLLFWLYVLNNFEEEEKSCRKKRHFTSCSSTKTSRHKHKPGMTAMQVSLY